MYWQRRGLIHHNDIIILMNYLNHCLFTGRIQTSIANSNCRLVPMDCMRELIVLSNQVITCNSLPRDQDAPLIDCRLIVASGIAPKFLVVDIQYTPTDPSLLGKCGKCKGIGPNNSYSLDSIVTRYICRSHRLTGGRVDDEGKNIHVQLAHIEAIDSATLSPLSVLLSLGFAVLQVTFLSTVAARIIVCHVVLLVWTGC